MMAPELSSPARSARYEIVRKLGHGGMGVVYLARDPDLGRLVALKFLPPHIGENREKVARFRIEARAISALNHPHVATIFGIEESGDAPFLVLEYLPGGTLREKLEARSVPIGHAVEWAVQIAEGLAHAHRHGILHRDVKSSNVLFTEEGLAKIADFGLAKMLNGESAPTQAGVALGTPRYMSPEQARGEEVDERSDVYSLGVVLSEIAAAVPAGSPGLDELQAVVARALRTAPEDRYANAGEMALALRRVRAELTPHSTDDTATIPPAAGRRLRKRPFWALGVLAAAALVSIAPALRDRAGGAPRIPAEKRIAVLLFTNVGGDPANQPIVDGLMEVVSNSLTRLEQFHGALTVAPAADVRKEGVASARDAGRVLAANLAITGSVERIGPNDVQVLINLVDTRTIAQIRTETIRARLTNLVALQEGVVEKVAAMLQLALQPAAANQIKAGNTSVPAAYPHYVEGLGFLRRYDRPANIDNAVAAFRRALAIDPKYVLAYAGAAQAHWRKYEALREPAAIDAALENASRALALNDQLATVHITMGMIRAGKGQYEPAEQELRRALELDPLSADAYRELAAVYEATGRASEAESTYRKAIELRKEDWWSLKQLGVFYFTHGRYADAERLFREVVSLTPDSAKAYSNLAAAYLKMNRRAEALAQLEHSVSIEPTANALSNLGSLYFYGGQYAEAAAQFEKAAALTPTDSRFWMNLADAYRWTPALASKAPATYRRAIEMLEREIAVNTRDAQLRSKLASCWASLGERQQSISEIEKAIAIAPSDGTVRFRAALVYEQAEQRSRALREVAAALQARFGMTEIRNAPPLKKLREDPRFRRMAENLK